jgi:hypothetical protein
MKIKGMDDEPIPISSTESPFERIEPPIDRPRPKLAERNTPEPVKNLHPEETQFSLRGMMILFTVTCCVLAVGARLPLDIFAGTLGILTLVSAGIMSLLDVRRALVHLAWWILLAAYLLVCFAAVLRTT